MQSAKNLLLLLAAIAAGALVLAWSEHQDLVLLRATSVSPEERANLQKRVWDAEKRAQELSRKLAAGGGGGTGSAAPAAAANRAGNGGGLMSNVFARMNDPEVQRLMAAQIRLQIERRYAALFAQLNLSPEKLEQFKQLLVDRQQSALDVLASANEQGISDPRDFQKLVEGAQSDIDGQIKAALGDADYSQFQGFQQTEAVRGVVSQLQSNLRGSAVPLTEAQASQLSQVMAQTSPGAAPSPGLGNTVRGAAVTDATLAQSQSFLSAPQIQALQQIQQQQQAQQRLRDIMLQGSPPAPEAGSPTGP
jgi:hypothetical protein